MVRPTQHARPMLLLAVLLSMGCRSIAGYGEANGERDGGVGRGDVGMPLDTGADPICGQRARERWTLPASLATTLKGSQGQGNGVVGQIVRAECNGDAESRGLFAFATQDLPDAVELESASITLCTQSVEGSVLLDLWAGDYPDVPTSKDFVGPWNTKLATFVPAPANSTTVLRGPGIWLGGTDRATRFGLLVAGCPGVNGGVTYSGDASSVNCPAPRLTVELCRGDSAEVVCGRAADCVVPAHLGACATAQCVDSRCIFIPAAAGTPCRASTSPCDPAEFCDGLRPICPANLQKSTTTFKSQGALVSFTVPLGLDSNAFEASCYGVEETRGVAIFETHALAGKLLDRAWLQLCQEKGTARAELYRVDITKPLSPGQFGASPLSLAATLDGPVSSADLGLNVEAITAPLTGFLLRLAPTVPCGTTWSGRRYSWVGSCSKLPQLVVEYCDP